MLEKFCRTLGSDGLAFFCMAAAVLGGGWLTFLFHYLMLPDIAMFLGASIITGGFVGGVVFALLMTAKYDLPYSTDEY